MGTFVAIVGVIILACIFGAKYLGPLIAGAFIGSFFGIVGFGGGISGAIPGAIVGALIACSLKKG